MMNGSSNKLIANNNNNNNNNNVVVRQPVRPAAPRIRLPHGLVDSYEYTKDKSKHFKRRPIENNNGIFSAFGMGRSEAAAILHRHFDVVKDYIQKAAEETLKTPQFINYLRTKDILPQLKKVDTDPLDGVIIRQSHGATATYDEDIDLSLITEEEQEKNAKDSYNALIAFQEGLSEVDLEARLKSVNNDIGDTYSINDLFAENAQIQAVQTDEHEVEQLDIQALSNREDVLKAYINYDVLMGNVESGNASIQVIKALAQVQKTVLYLWVEQASGSPMAHFDNRNVYLHDRQVGDAPVSLRDNVHNQLHILIGDRNHYQRLTRQSDGKLIKHPIPARRDLGYEAFGLTRKEAYEVLREHKAAVKCYLREPIRLALMRRNFVKSLVDESLSSDAQERLQAKEQILLDHLDIKKNKPASIDFLEKCEVDDDIIDVYLKYDVNDKSMDEGWSQYHVMMALGYLMDVKVVLWERNLKNHADIGKTEQFNVVKTNVQVAVARNAVILVKQSEQQADANNPPEDRKAEIEYNQWLTETRKVFARELHLFCKNNNEFERMEELHPAEYLSDEYLAELQLEKENANLTTMLAADRRKAFKQTPPTQLMLLNRKIHAKHNETLIRFYMETAENAVKNDLWLVLRYLLKDSKKRTKIELRLRKEIQNCEEKSQRLCDRISLLNRQVNVLEYLYLREVSHGGSLDRWDSVSDSKKIQDLQSIMDKMLERTQKLLYKDFEHSASKGEQWAVNDNLEMIQMAPEQKKAKYAAWLRSMQFKLNANDMMAGHGFAQTYKTLLHEIMTMQRLSEFHITKMGKYNDFLTIRQEMLGDSMNDQQDPNEFLEPVDAFLNKYRDDIMGIIGREFEVEYNNYRRNAGLPEGDLAYEYLCQHSPSIAREPFVIDKCNDLLTKALNERKVFLGRALLLLEVDPTVENEFSQSAGELAQSLRDVELTEMINQRIMLNKSMDDDSTWESWLEQESKLISKFTAYVRKLSPGQTDKENPRRAKMISYKTTAYNNPSIVVTLYNSVSDNKPTFKDKLDLWMGLYKRCIVVDSQWFRPILEKIHKNIEETKNIKNNNAKEIMEALYKRFRYVSNLREEAIDAALNKKEATLIDRKNSVVEHVKNKGRNIPFMDNMTGLNDDVINDLQLQYDEYSKIFDTFLYLQSLVYAGSSMNHYEALVSELETKIERQFVNPSYSSVISKLCELAVEYRKNKEYKNNFDALQLSQTNYRRNEITNDYQRGLQNQGKWMATARTNNALFSAVAMFMNNHQKEIEYTEQSLRSIAVEFMKNNRNEYDDHSDTAFENHKNKLSLDGEPIKRSDIKTLALALKIEIDIENTDGTDHSVQGSGKGVKIFLKSVGDGHYDVKLPEGSVIHDYERVYSMNNNVNNVNRVPSITGSPVNSRGR